MLRIAVSLYGDMGEIGAGWCVSDELSYNLPPSCYLLNLLTILRIVYKAHLASEHLSGICLGSIVLGSLLKTRLLSSLRLNVSVAKVIMCE